MEEKVTISNTLEIVEERQALQRVMKTEGCWKCAKRKATNDLGVCDECLEEMRAPP